MRKSIAAVIILLFIVFLSIGLRVYHLNQKPVWYDEAVSIADAEKPFSYYLSCPLVNYKPVYFLLLNLWIRSFGESAAATRFFSVIGGVLSVVLIYQLGTMIFNRASGLISAFLLSISVFHVFHSQQIRHFSFFVLLALISALCCFKFIHERNRNYLVPLTLVSIVIVFTHPYGFSIIIFESLYFLSKPDRALLKNWLIPLIILFAGVVWWMLLPNKAAIYGKTWWITAPDLRDLLETINTFSYGGPRYGLNDFKIWGGDQYWMRHMPGNRAIADSAFLLTALYLFLMLKGVFVKTKASYDKILFLLIWLITPIFLAFTISVLGIFQVFAIKHLIIALPAFLLLISRGVDMLGRKTKTLILLVVVGLHVLPLKVMYSHYFSTDWKSSAAHVKTLVKNQDAIILYPLMEVVPFVYYYRGTTPSLADMSIYGRSVDGRYRDTFMLENDNLLVSGIKQTGFGDKRVTSENDFRQKAQQYHFNTFPNVWFMVSRWTDPEAGKIILEYFGKHFTIKECKKFQGVLVYKFSH